MAASALGQLPSSIAGDKKRPDHDDASIVKINWRGRNDRIKKKKGGRLKGRETVTKVSGVSSQSPGSLSNTAASIYT